MRKVAVCIALVVASVSVSAQENPTIVVNVNVVTLLATVRSRDGEIVSNLTPNDFVLKEDGVPEKIRYFSQESDIPLTVGLLVDTSRSQAGVLAQESAASRIFLGQVLRKEDRAFVMHFDTEAEVLQGPTSSRSNLASTLEHLTIPDRVATLLYSAVERSSARVMGQQRGRKALILLTDGVAWKDPVSINAAIEAAQRADTILYSIRFSDPVQARGLVRAAVLKGIKEHGKDALKRMAKETGGASYDVTRKQTISAIYAQIEEDLRNQYSIGYTPGRNAPDGRYHRIELTTRDRQLVVSARDGYYSH